MEEKIFEQFEKNISQATKNDIYCIFETYQGNGYECWLVGGTVRDLILGLNPKDFDFATNCPLEKTKEFFSSVIPTGEDHGTLTIHISGGNYEITRFRKDVATDGRRATIEFSETIEEDLLRRDLTINAIAFNPVNKKIVDVTNGLNDIKNKTLRFVGNVEDRIREDQLRALRLFKFFTRLNFNISESDLKILHDAYDHSIVSVERIYKEMDDIFTNMSDSHHIKIFLISEFKKLNVFKRFNVVGETYDELFYLRDYFPLVKHCRCVDILKLGSRYKKLLNLFNMFFGKNLKDEKIIKDLLEMSQGEIVDTKLVIEYCNYYSNCYDSNISFDIIDNIISTNQPFMAKHLDINGNDIQLLGYKGEEIGKKIKYLLELVKLDKILNKKEFLIETLKTLDTCINKNIEIKTNEL